MASEIRNVRVVCRSRYHDGHRTKACGRLLYTWRPSFALDRVPTVFTCDRCKTRHRVARKRLHDALTTALNHDPPKVELPLPPASPRPPYGASPNRDGVYPDLPGVRYDRAATEALARELGPEWRYESGAVVYRPLSAPPDRS